jgi:AcrR family transcriptional regulator
VPRKKPAKRRIPRDETKQRTRETLLAAALELFAEHGLDGPSLDAICERAGFTRGAFYVHFADREELLVAVMNQVGEACIASIFAGLAGSPPARNESALRTAAMRFVDAVKSGTYPLMPSPEGRPYVRMHHLVDACVRSNAVRERYRSLIEASVSSIGAVVAGDQNAGLVRDDVAREDVGKLLLATIVGAQTLIDVGVATDMERLAQTLLTMLESKSKKGRT